MSFKPITLKTIKFTGPGRANDVEFKPGVNVVCGASDTGKSFLAESIDFMLGGSALKEIPERVPYASASLTLGLSTGVEVEVSRALAGGNFQLQQEAVSVATLRSQHAHDKTDNLSGYLLEAIGLNGKRVLKSKVKSTTQSLSFRNLARLVIVQEGEIQSADSPFLSGQFISRTPDLATVKLLLTGVDDSAVVTIDDTNTGAEQITLLNEIIAEVQGEIEDEGEDRHELESQIERLATTVEAQRQQMRAVQGSLDLRMRGRKTAYDEWAALSNRATEIEELLARFELLERHYLIDQERLAAIEESGSLFVHMTAATCPLCGALSDARHTTGDCDGDIEPVVLAAQAENRKIQQLLSELRQTVSDLRNEMSEVSAAKEDRHTAYEALDVEIRASMAPMFEGARSQYDEVIEKRAEVQAKLNAFVRLEKLERRRQDLVLDVPGDNEKTNVESGIPDASAYAIAIIVERILKAWNFPGDCRVHFDKEKSDFVIDGKPRGSRGKGLRAISHAAINISLLEYCRERSLPHPGFVILDSPLLAYFEPEGPEDEELQGTDLKDRFYDYLTKHHGRDSQIIVIENTHPPAEFDDKLSLTVFTRNPSMGRFGLL